MIGEHYNDKWKDLYTQPPTILPWVMPGTTPNHVHTTPAGPSREEFEALRRDVLEMKALLIRAKKYDEDNDEPACEVEEKVALLKRVADMVGVSLEDVFGKQN
jgi:hypothetical protein